MASRFLGLGNGSDGVIALGSYTPLKYTCSGSSAASSLTATGTFSAGDRLFIHQSRGTGAGYYEDNRVASYTTGTITLVHPLEHTYTDSGNSQAQVLVVKEASSVTGTITAPAWDGNVGGVFIIACNGVFNGIVSANAKGFRGGIGASDYDGYQGEGYPGYGVKTSPTNRTANGNGAGGASGSNNTSKQMPGGGGGGHAVAGTIGNDPASQGTPGAAGGAIGTATLTSLYFGGGGGGGAGRHGGGVTWWDGGTGGTGGGIIVVYANSFSSTASLIMNGANGGVGETGDSGAGGGGAGGSGLMKCVKGTIGSSKITATAGTGGASEAGAGAAGRIRIESCSLSGTTSPTASTATGGHSYCGGGAFIF